MKQTSVISYTQIPYNVFATEIEGSVKNDFYNEVAQIIKYYEIYDEGAEFSVEGSNGDYVPSDTPYKKIRDLIDKESRFLFSIPPTFTVNRNMVSLTEAQREMNTTLNEFLDRVLSKNQFDSKLVKAARDCFIGKRIACMLNFNETEGITLSFLNSQEFLYDMKGSVLNRIVAIYILQDSSNKADQVVKKKIYEMGDDGFCYVEEALYDGLGTMKEEGRLERTKTLFQRIPAVVILNEGLTNDSKGSSEVALLSVYESQYSKLANADIDAERKSMNPTKYAIDASAGSTENLSSAAGAFWDIQSDQSGSDPHTATVGMLEAGMNYSEALKTTLNRLEDLMFSQVEVPNINSETIQGVITSGKTLKALYWSLIVRCNEKMLIWGPALKYLAECIIEGAFLYPDSVTPMFDEKLPYLEVYDVTVENSYPLPEDEVEEKTIDLAEVSSQVMSRKSYMKKWRNLTDEECDAELEQIAKERAILEDSFYQPMGGGPVGSNRNQVKQDMGEE